MALKHEGYDVSVWDDWSAQDTTRYHGDRGECQKKWRSFSGNATPVTGGTVVQYARSQGWQPAYRGEDVALDWDSVIGDCAFVDANWLETRDLPKAPDDWNPAAELTRYLSVLFKPDEHVGYVNECYEKDGKWIPANSGAYDRTASALIAEIKRYKGDIHKVIGDTKPECGAWIRFNPLDGEGVRNDNVTCYRYALVESDDMEIDKQYTLMHELELPIAMIVHSGGKSLHAIVRIDAPDYDEYRRRVDYLYAVCGKNGLQIDTQNRNPSRLSRMPGVMRKGNRQYIVETDVGKKDWNEWKEWIESRNDDLPELESMADAWDKLPPLSPPLIDGVLRMGHKMLLVGPSKAGKSFALIELCICIAEGVPWFGWRCAQGRVLYINLELDRASCLHRIRDVYAALGVQPRNLQNLDIWNLRGKAVPMDALTPKLNRRAEKRGYTAIVIDPIYKVITGDENSADQMASFCNEFDKICTALGCAVIYCHHHSKGGQAGKRSMDRASGSGVFARDPDAMLDMIELDVTESLRKSEGDRAEISVLEHAYDEATEDKWREAVSQDDLCSVATMRSLSATYLTREQEYALAQPIADARHRVERRTAWRIEGTLREFESFKPLNLWFDYPVHRGDTTGALGDLSAEGEAAKKGNWHEAGRAKAINTKKDQQQRSWTTLQTGFEALNENGSVSVSALMEYSGLTRNTVKTWVNHQPEYEISKRNTITRIEQECQSVNTGENDT